MPSKFDNMRWLIEPIDFDNIEENSGADIETNLWFHVSSIVSVSDKLSYHILDSITKCVLQTLALKKQSQMLYYFETGEFYGQQ